MKVNRLGFAFVGIKTGEQDYTIDETLVATQLIITPGMRELLQYWLVASGGKFVLTYFLSFVITITKHVTITLT